MRGNEEGGSLSCDYFSMKIAYPRRKFHKIDSLLSHWPCIHQQGLVLLLLSYRILKDRRRTLVPWCID
jgi:hypothetical protein